MSQKKARAQRKAAPEKPKPEAPKDSRQAIKLDAVTAEDAFRLLNTTLNQALESPQMQIVMRNILKGRRMVLNSIGKAEPDLPWGWQLQNPNLGDLWLVPTRKEELPQDAKPEEVKTGSPSAGVVAEADRKAKVEAEGKAKADSVSSDSKAPVDAEPVAKDSA